MLQYFKVTPYLVFDGDDLPSKSGTETHRHRRREESKVLATELERKGKTREAFHEFTKAVDVTPYMARQLIEELKKMNVQYLVAPYEADAQLVYLEREGIIDGIMSEDSDMLAFGAKKLVSKLDQHGECVVINRADFAACTDVSLVGWTDADFRRMCILSGCDYLPNITRLGLKTAYRCIRKYRDVERALRMLQFEGQHQVPPDYLQNFKQAELTFIYQRVFCPKAGRLVTLTQPESDVVLEELTFIGDDMDPETAVGVASGDLHPTTKDPIILQPLASSKPSGSIDRRQTLGSEAELKPNKPISSFFTPKRTPLAELDPNSLTPSPSQQQLLHRHANNSWEARPAPFRPSAVGSAPSGTSGRVSSPLVRSADRTSFLAHAARLSSFQPSKRPRLCSETEQSLPSRPDCRSRFFASNADGASPTGQKAMRNKKPRKSSLSVYSDEVAEDIMSQIPDPGETVPDAGDTATVPCRSSDQESKQQADPRHPVNTRNGERDEPRDEGGRTSTMTEKSVGVESDRKTFHKVLDHHIERQNSALLSKYTFQPEDNRESTKTGGLDGKSSHVHNGPALKSMGSTPNLERKPAARNSPGQRLTPLQRLGRSALSRSKSLNALAAKGANEPSHERVALGSRNLNTGSATAAHGSEDMLVPDSEEEDVDYRDGKETQQPSVDLKRFTFTS